MLASLAVSVRLLSGGSRRGSPTLCVGSVLGAVLEMLLPRFSATLSYKPTLLRCLIDRD